jgi:cyanate permease
VGILHEATGGWTWVLIALAAKSLLLIYCAVVLAREALVEDDVRMPAGRPGS